jgi:hypothetical protein
MSFCPVVVVLLTACASARFSGPAPDGNVDTADDAPPAADAALPPGCAADIDCASGVCHEATGTCVEEAHALYVATTGSDAAMCTRTAPCASIARAVQLLTADRNTIALAAGRYTGAFQITTPALISGPSADPSAVVLASPSGGAVIGRLQHAAIELETVSFRDNVAASTPALYIDAAATVTLDRVVVRHNAAIGMFVVGAHAVATRCDFSEDQYGVLADSTSSVNIARTTVEWNTQWGIASAGDYQIVNTFFVHNPGAFQPYGTANTGILDFNTYVQQSGGPVLSTHAVALNSSIFAGNAKPCDGVVISYSLFDTGAAPGDGNFNGDPDFVDPLNGNFHIGPTSAAIDHADPAATLATDFDGNPRPIGPARDCGADER